MRTPLEEQYHDKIVALLRKHQMGEHNDPGGKCFTHVRAGRFNVELLDERDSGGIGFYQRTYEAFRRWLVQKGLETA